MCNARDKFQKEIRKISSRGSSSLKCAELGHFALFFAENGYEISKDLFFCLGTFSLPCPLCC